ncbi:methyl-accepting chemotaxis protein [Aneurinibacillus terranovensis]|uniref:methyl-accepting chemotaxis protein n=1 Tax=Aneurinibacillus terranovensis TaxID=278991 RepID=UPI00040E1C65|nr:methyl-accepting chemotaxis protein [Aneurinibacillus terranovensis]
MGEKFRFTIRSKLLSSYFIIILLFSVVGYMSYAAFTNVESHTSDIVLDAIPTGNAAKGILTDLINQETGVRGYVLTGQESFLDPYISGKAQLEKDLATIREHEANHPIMKQLLEGEASQKIQNIQTFFESEISLVKNGKTQDALKKIDGGKQDMDAFRGIYEKMNADVTKLINDASNASKQASEKSKLIILIGEIVILLIVIIVALLQVRAIIRPIRTMDKQLKEIAEGEGDLTREIHLATNDEISDLSKSFNQMLANLRGIIRQVMLTTEHVASSAEQLNASADQTSKATEHIASTIQELAGGSEEQYRSVEGSTKEINTMAQEVQQITENTNAVFTTSTKASKMAEEGTGAIKKAVSQMSSINSTISKLSQVVKELGDRSQEVGTIIDVITGIAEQTNLLALNAAIEAARAGENGRGFAVVADEVRKLAEQSGQSAQKIGELVATIQDETNKVTESMKESIQEVAVGMDVVNNAGELFSRIQQLVSEVEQQIKEVTAASQHIAKSTDQVASRMNTISEVAKTTTAGTQTVSASVEEQLASMEEISSSSTTLTSVAEELRIIIEKFKV